MPSGSPQSFGEDCGDDGDDGGDGGDDGDDGGDDGDGDGDDGDDGAIRVDTVIWGRLRCGKRSD